MSNLSNCQGADMVVFYHADNDGKVCAAIIQELYPKCWCYPVNHNKDVRWDLIDNVTTVVIVDFSFPLEVMTHLKNTYKLIWIDHHPIVNEYREKGFTCEGKCECSPGRSAAMLVWEYFHPNTNPPWVVKYISDYDTWHFQYEDDTKKFSAAFGQLETSPIDKCKIWHNLFHDADFIGKMLATGGRILDYIRESNQLLTKDCCFKTEIDGVPALAANVKDTNSSFFDSCDEKDYPIRILFRYFHNIQKMRVSIYSIDEEKYPANEIAKKFGGNGHPGASGCVVPMDQLPFKVPIPTKENQPNYTNIYQPLLDTLQNDPLANRYANLNLIPTVLSGSKPMKINGVKVVAINHPAIFANSFYVTGLNMFHDIGLLWSLTNTGWYRYRFYSLHPEIDLTKLREIIGGGMVVGNSVWHYDQNDIFKCSFATDDIPF